jgi:hippurate hydrolase
MSGTAISRERLSQLIEQELPNLIKIRHDLHAHPELAFQEHRTSGVVQRELEDLGIAFKAELAQGTGVMGHLPGASDKALGLRADMDALPIQEETGAEYASTCPGKMHACGHDGHTAILIGAARVLARIGREQELPRPVSLIFQPAEEGGGGGRRMVEDGCLHGTVIGPAIEHMFGLHGWPELALGKVSTRPGPMLAATDRFEIEVSGIGGHAAYPHQCSDPLLAAAAIVGAVQQIASRNVDPLDAVVVSVTQLHAGTADNIIVGRATLTGTVRTLQPQTQELVQRRLAEIAEHIANAHGCRGDLRYEVGYPVTSNDPVAVDIFQGVAQELLGPEQVPPMAVPVMGGEDFSFYGQVVPACFFALGLAPPGPTRIPDLHQPDFNFNDDAISVGVELFCRLALRS